MSVNLQLAFYKGAGGKNGAVQFNYSAPHYYVKGNSKLKNYDGKFIKDAWLKDNPGLTKDDLTSREGAVFMEITSTSGKNVYDWEKKIVMALSIHDLGQVLAMLSGLTPEVNLTHDPGAKSASAGKVRKYLKVTSPKGLKEGAIISMTQSVTEGDKVSHMVPLNASEVTTLATCLRAAVPLTLGWA